MHVDHTHLPVCEHVRAKVVGIGHVLESSYPCITLILAQGYRHTDRHRKMDRQTERC